MSPRSKEGEPFARIVDRILQETSLHDSDDTLFPQNSSTPFYHGLRAMLFESLWRLMSWAVSLKKAIIGVNHQPPGKRFNGRFKFNNMK
jgi:hypothetical protein